MAAKKQLVTVFNLNGSASDKTIPLPEVFVAPIRKDLVSSVHALLLLNTRQPYAVSDKAGHQTSAESWGTGRAVARIPRVRGGGTHRSGQAAYGNMCRGGRMFAPTKVWRKWHHRISRRQRHYAFSSAIAATAIPAVVQARGHVIDKLKEVPLVVENKLENIKKTKEAIALLKSINALDDVKKCIATRRMRGTKGKMRNRRFKMKRGPLVVYKNDNGITKAFRNIPGVSLMSTNSLNLLKLAPGGHLGRFVIWTEGAFEDMNRIFGSYMAGVTRMPLPIMKLTDMRAIIRSIAAKNVVRAPKVEDHTIGKRKRPLKADV